MKQLNLLKTLFLLCALVVGSLNSWADVSTLEFTSACGGSGTADDGKVWTVTSDADESNYDVNRGVHYGTSKKEVEYIQLSSSDFTSGTITKIVVNASGANSPTLSVKVGGVDFDTAKTGLTNSNVAYTFNGSASADEIVVRIAKTSAATGALYCKSIAVTYSTGAVVNVTGVTLDPTELTLTVGDKETLTATVAPADATNKSVTWESDNTSVATVADGVVTAVAEGTCTITATTVDGGFTATCDVTVKAAAVAATLDFTDNSVWQIEQDAKTEGTHNYTNGYTITLYGPSGNGYYFDSGANNLLLGKKDASLTLPAFSFNVNKIKVYGVESGSASVTFNIYVGDDAVSTPATSSKVDHDFAIAADKQAAGNVYVIKVTNANNMRISKIEIFGYDEKVVTAAGYATYVTEHNVEFAEGDAYAVTIDGGVAKLNAVTAVPAGTPVLLKGEGTKNPAVLEDAPAAPAANDLKEGDGTTPTNAYVLANQTKGVGFYKWNGGNIPAGKVYLDASGVAAHEFISIDLENGEATGINEIAADKTFNGEFFNLAGQRVAQPTKGLYIVNGKKIVVK